jgi:hypothetical protein
MTAVRKRAEIFKLNEWFHRIEEQNEAIKNWIKRSVQSGDIEKAEIGRRRLKVNIDKMKEIVRLIDNPI